ncbi:hypothetical protein BDFB_001477 [Asbolus verrucosus]|uniref:Uncharacterized protein n=1 Tax=Asbolus verrucosus TaxID=1661398 RepID=A0A482WC73_ASBVE|nr:hypothetical protein BDFB_001477 [Asbolus verrucosus]
MPIVPPSAPLLPAPHMSHGAYKKANAGLSKTFFSRYPSATLPSDSDVIVPP